MIDPRYSEDEQAERLKEWWKKNGTSIILGVVIGVGAIAGVNYWRDYTRSQSENASARFAQLLSSRGDESQQIGLELMQDFASTPYAGLSSLYRAKEYYQAGEIEQAEAMLRWARDNAKQSDIQHAATLRLARIFLEQDKLTEAADLANVEDFDGFTSEYKELQGDIAIANGEFAAARAAYEQALNELARGSEYAELLLLKIDHAIGVSKQ